MIKDLTHLNSSFICHRLEWRFKRQKLLTPQILRKYTRVAFSIMSTLIKWATTTKTICGLSFLRRSNNTHIISMIQCLLTLLCTTPPMCYWNLFLIICTPIAMCTSMHRLAGRAQSLSVLCFLLWQLVLYSCNGETGFYFNRGFWLNSRNSLRQMG